MEARPEDDGEARYVCDPADFADDDNQHYGPAVLEGLEDVACGLEDDSNGGDDDGPEVDAGMTFECHVNEDEELDAHPVRDCAD